MKSIAQDDDDISKVLATVTSAAGINPKTSSRRISRTTFVDNCRDDFASDRAVNEHHLLGNFVLVNAYSEHRRSLDAIPFLRRYDACD